MTRARLRRIARDPKGLIGLTLTMLIILAATGAPRLAPYDPLRQDLSRRNIPPSWIDPEGRSYWLGTDQLGRDLLSRTIYGARISVAVGIVAVVLAGIVGLTLGVLSGYRGGLTDSVIMRVVDIQLAFPTVLLAIAWVAFIGTSLASLVAVIAVSGWVAYARIARSVTLSLRETSFVEAAVAVGADSRWVMRRHIVPNVFGSMIVLGTLQLGRAVLLESTLSFLGLGVQPPTPTWGGMLADGRAYLDTAWWIAAFPGLAIMTFVLSVNLLGDSLRDVLDPRSERTQV